MNDTLHIKKNCWMIEKYKHNLKDILNYETWWYLKKKCKIVSLAIFHHFKNDMESISNDGIIPWKMTITVYVNISKYTICKYGQSSKKPAMMQQKMRVKKKTSLFGHI